MSKGIIFDFNGVLWWDHQLQEESWNEFAIALRGHPLSELEMTSQVHGRSNRNTISYLVGYKPNEQEMLDLINQKESQYRKLCLAEGKGFRLSPGALDLLDDLQKLRIPRTIATASEITNLEFFFEHLELDTWFDRNLIIYDDGLILGKPAPDVYLRAASMIELDPRECLVVEDSVSGLEAAYAAGIGTILALGPPSRHQEIGSIVGVSEVITSLAELSVERFTPYTR